MGQDYKDANYKVKSIIFIFYINNYLYIDKALSAPTPFRAIATITISYAASQICGLEETDSRAAS